MIERIDEDEVYLAQEKEAGEYAFRSDYRDLSLREKVGEALKFYEEIDASSIFLEVHNGVVTLMGSVASEREKIEAEDLVFEIDEVVEVFNNLEVN